MKKEKWKNSDEKEALLQDSNTKLQSTDTKLSKARELAMMFTLYFVQFLALCSDSIIVPFFPKVAVERGISNLLIGLVFASYDLTRFLASPICGSLVSSLLS